MEYTNILVSMVGGLLVLLIGVVSYVGKCALDKLDRISGRLGEINGRTGKLETWALSHEKQDDKEFQRIADEQKEQWEKINNRTERQKG